MNTTRDIDLADIEEYRDSAQTKEQRDQREALLLNVWYQSKDVVLEASRRELESLLKQYFNAVEKDNLMQMSEYQLKIEKLRGKIQSYVSSDAYREKMAQMIQKYSHSEAEKMYKKLGKGKNA